jgi:ribosomal protein S15P/S13E
MAYERLVDRLLASPRYGERWGRHWLDVVRYADTAGDNADYPVPELHQYRDFVIASFNADKPYDEFLREQLAGDIMATAVPDRHYAERVIGTGFIALSRRYGTMPGELWHLTLEDTIDTVGQAFLGLTLRCARCHDHKFDPVTTEDYYALYGIFDSTRYAYAGSEEYQSKGLNRTGFMPLAPPAEAAPQIAAHAERVNELRRAFEQAEKDDPATLELAKLQTNIDSLVAQLKDVPTDEQQQTQRKQELQQLEDEHKKIKRDLEKKLRTLRDELRDAQRSGLPPDMPGAYAVCEGTPHDVPVQRRGEPGEPGPVAKRNAPKFLRGETELTIAAGASAVRRIRSRPA